MYVVPRPCSTYFKVEQIRLICYESDVINQIMSVEMGKKEAYRVKSLCSKVQDINIFLLCYFTGSETTF
jgi:hypothetical protein